MYVTIKANWLDVQFLLLQSFLLPTVGVLGKLCAHQSRAKQLAIIEQSGEVLTDTIPGSRHIACAQIIDPGNV